MYNSNSQSLPRETQGRNSRQKPEGRFLAIPHSTTSDHTIDFIAKDITAGAMEEAVCWGLAAGLSSAGFLTWFRMSVWGWLGAE